MTQREERLRREYVEGRIEVDEFERRLELLLKGAPDPLDLQPIYSDKPGTVFQYNPINGTPEWVRPGVIMTRTDADLLEQIQRIKALRSRG